jgi:hypothetical protein
MPSTMHIRPIEIAVLAIVRAAPATMQQIGQFFPELPSDELGEMLDELQDRSLLVCDGFGVVWATRLACEVLDANSVTVWFGGE